VGSEERTTPLAADPTRPPLPTELQVEVTASCNLRCPMCLVAYREPVGRVSGAMPHAHFRRLVDELPLRRITLQGLGEPLLCPDLSAMVELAATRGIECGFNTNGTLLTPVRARQLVDAGVAWVHVSIDGATAPTYESIRIGARFERVVEHIRSLVDARATSGGTRPEISLVTVLMRRNAAELPRLVELAADCGADELWVQALSHSFDDVSSASEFDGIRAFTSAEALWHDDDATDVVAEAGALAEQRGLRFRAPGAGTEASRQPGTPGCDWPWRAAYVRRDGGVQPCCMVMGEDREILGRLSDHDFATIWHGQAYREFRAALLGDEPPAVCGGCSLYRGLF
jgi:MoaA/NifB/PqqE/SkfB family radical SAM enzyme